jgi:predicted DNA-binding transcriptional regulator AlpA
MERLLNTKQAGELLNLGYKSLANSRSRGTGIHIPYIKVGRLIRYKQSDIEAYIETNTFNHTGECAQ